MIKYIGIRGHRGAGKNTLSYLLGVAIEFYVKHHNWDGFDEVYNQAVERVLEDETFIEQADFRYVFFESFADTAKIMLYQLTGVPVSCMYDDWCKDSMIINMKDFSVYQPKDKLEYYAYLKNHYLRSAEELKQIATSSSIEDFTGDEHDDEILVTLRELISYFSKYVMQSFFGKNVWIKSLKVNKLDSEKFFSGNKKTYKIFTDCKFPSEISYILNNTGKIVKVSRADNVKEETNISEELKNDNRFDYEINFNGDLNDPETKENIKSITIQLVD